MALAVLGDVAEYDVPGPVVELLFRKADAGLLRAKGLRVVVQLKFLFKRKQEISLSPD